MSRPLAAFPPLAARSLGGAAGLVDETCVMLQSGPRPVLTRHDRPERKG
ncbi:hypothetical protein SAMN05444006_108129 [Allgaiera indica]|uniref:Uncharacterized protein n=1 Tax=Allgaiera indica TaxID=765699 RepID=A0A1H2XSA0_9RHOB|nr:hypothetical protein SAMN05444006_108129 [Allgaiera indica]